MLIIFVVSSEKCIIIILFNFEAINTLNLFIFPFNIHQQIYYFINNLIAQFFQKEGCSNKNYYLYLRIFSSFRFPL